jgi:hypothetical protein
VVYRPRVSNRVHFRVGPYEPFDRYTLTNDRARVFLFCAIDGRSWAYRRSGFTAEKRCQAGPIWKVKLWDEMRSALSSTPREKAQNVQWERTGRESVVRLVRPTVTWFAGRSWFVLVLFLPAFDPDSRILTVTSHSCPVRTMDIKTAKRTSIISPTTLRCSTFTVYFVAVPLRDPLASLTRVFVVSLPNLSISRTFLDHVQYM